MYAFHGSEPKSLSLDSSIQLYSAENKIPEDGEKSITFKDLATHWSGLARRPDNWADPDATDPYATYTDPLFFDYIANYSFTELHIREQYLYSNAAFGLLAYVLSNDMGRSNFSDMLSTTFFQPLKMSSSGLVIDSKTIDNLAVGHSEDGSCRDWGWSCEAVLGSWAVRSTTRDMVRFLGANIAASASPLEQVGVAGGASVGVAGGASVGVAGGASALLRAMAMSHQVLRPTDTEGYSIGLGWRIEDSTGTRMKSGSGDGQESNMYINVEYGLGLVVLSNSFIDSPNDIDTTSTYIFNQMLKAASKRI